MFSKKPIVIACALLFAGANVARADSYSDLAAQVKALQAQLKAIQDQLDKQSQEQKKTEQTAVQANTTAASAMESAKKAVAAFERIPVPDAYKPGTVNQHVGESNPAVADSGNFLHRERDDSLTFSTTHGGAFTLYGNFDVSIDETTNGIGGAPNNGLGGNGPYGQTGPFGNTGWIPAISTNNTYVGLRGFQPITGWHDMQFLWQLQTNISLTAVAGTGETNSTISNTASGALTTGTSYVGFGSKDFGTIAAGKTFAPYELSTLVFNPFKGMLGSMGTIMGNTGGDNRIEFGTLVEHAIWYQSPNYDGLSFSALFAPAQNTSQNSSNIPMGGSNCAGGDTPGNGGNLNLEGVAACNDGGFSNLVSASVVYDDKKSLYATIAYEVHTKVNRSSDLAGLGALPDGSAPATDNSNPNAALYDSQDVANEWAAKIGLMYTFQSTGTSLGGIYEVLRRNVPSDLTYQNERSRNGSWVLLKQDLPGANQLLVGWGHAGQANGDPGQHSDGNIAGSPGQKPDNRSNMYSFAALHQVDRNLSFYANYAMTLNGPAAHYDLGAGGHGYYVDCHDAGGIIPAGGAMGVSSPNCWTGAKLQALSVGMKYRF
jgi:predicted porin